MSKGDEHFHPSTSDSIHCTFVAVFPSRACARESAREETSRTATERYPSASRQSTSREFPPPISTMESLLPVALFRIISRDNIGVASNQLTSCSRCVEENCSQCTCRLGVS